MAAKGFYGGGEETERTSLVAHAKGPSAFASGTESDSLLAPDGQRPPTFCEVQTGDLIKSVIYGGLDAVINSASTVAAVYGELCWSVSPPYLCPCDISCRRGSLCPRGCLAGVRQPHR